MQLSSVESGIFYDTDNKKDTVIVFSSNIVIIAIIFSVIPYILYPYILFSLNIILLSIAKLETAYFHNHKVSGLTHAAHQEREWKRLSCI